MYSPLHISRKLNFIPLSWAGATEQQDYLNLGDALSPVIVAALSQKEIKRVSMRSSAPRISSTGSILSNFVGGKIDVWGSGMSPTYNPMTKEHTGYKYPPSTKIYPRCLRGPFTQYILERSGVEFDFSPGYGDPVILLKSFYNPYDIQANKKYELGVVIHLSETDGRSLDSTAFDHIARYKVPAHMQNSVRIINTLSGISSIGLKSKIDEILQCKRIISTSFHGLLLAELYNIPCMYVHNSVGGLKYAQISLENEQEIDIRFLDFFLSVELAKRCYYCQPKNEYTDWESLIMDIDRSWEPLQISPNQLIETFPLDLNPLKAFKGESLSFFNDSRISCIPFQGNPTKISDFSKSLSHLS